MSFETDNQDKSNLVGDAKVMSDAVDAVQLALKRNDERLALIDEVRELKQEALDLKVVIRHIEDEAKAWDDLEALVKETKSGIVLHPNQDDYWHRFIVGDAGNVPLFSSKEFSKEAVSNALESIKGES